MQITIVFEAKYHKLDDIDDVCNNFYENYPHLAANMKEIGFEKQKGKYFKIIWEGEFEDGDLEESDVDEVIRLTHHAEGFYDDTNVEYVHVEVCIDGTWYGK